MVMMQNNSPDEDTLAKPSDQSEDAVVDAIAATDASDPVLQENTKPEEESHVFTPPQNWFQRLVRSRKFWIRLILLLLFTSAFVWLIQPIRIATLNALGFRSPLDVTVLVTQAEGQPVLTLKNAIVTINGALHTTDEKGEVHTRLPYGEVKLAVAKMGYESVEKTIKLDVDPFFGKLGSAPESANTNQQITLKSVGIALEFTAQDWLTELPLSTGEFSMGDVTARPNDNGQVSLLIPATDAKTIKVTAKFSGQYIGREFELEVGAAEPKNITFVPVGAHYFVSKRSGSLGVYKSNIDGGEVVEVVPASAQETSDLTIAVSPSGKFMAVVSTRDGKRDNRGTLLQKLYLVDLSNNKIGGAIDEGLKFNFVDWSGETLAYVVTQRASDGATSQRLASTTTAGKRTDLSTAYAQKAARVILGSVAYMPQTGASTKPELRLVKLTGGAERTLGYDILQIVQPDFDWFVYQTADTTWHEYNVNLDRLKSASPPGSLDRVFLNSTSADGQQRLILDTVDGAPAIISKSVGNGQEKQLFRGPGVRGPVGWAANTVLFRVVDGGQAADWAVSLQGGKPKKIIDVTPGSPNPNYGGFY